MGSGPPVSLLLLVSGGSVDDELDVSGGSVVELDSVSTTIVVVSSVVLVGSVRLVLSEPPEVESLLSLLLLSLLSVALLLGLLDDGLVAPVLLDVSAVVPSVAVAPTASSPAHPTTNTLYKPTIQLRMLAR